MKNNIKTVFYNRTKSYIFVILLGLIAGLLVAFFSRFPDDDLWAFSYFSSQCLGFWMFSTSIIVVFSEKRLNASINAFIYVAIMFFITGIYKGIREWNFNMIGVNNSSELLKFYKCESMFEYVLIEIYESIVYGVMPGLVCGLLAAVLWNARKNNWFGKILLALPAIFIGVETILLYKGVLTQHTQLFMTIIDTLCLIFYLKMFAKNIFSKDDTKILIRE